MSIVVRFPPVPGATAEQYDEAVRRIQESGDFPPDGLELHIAFGPESELRVSEIWDSREQFEAFGERLMPVLAELGLDAGEPEVFEVYNIVRRR
jgi:hypothetical protein